MSAVAMCIIQEDKMSAVAMCIIQQDKMSSKSLQGHNEDHMLGALENRWKMYFQEQRYIFSSFFFLSLYDAIKWGLQWLEYWETHIWYIYFVDVHILFWMQIFEYSSLVLYYLAITLNTTIHQLSKNERKTLRELQNTSRRTSHLFSICQLVFTKLCHYYYCHYNYCHYYYCP